MWGMVLQNFTLAKVHTERSSKRKRRRKSSKKESPYLEQLVSVVLPRFKTIATAHKKVGLGALSPWHLVKDELFLSCWRGRGYEFWHESWASTICRRRKFNREVYSLPALIWLRSSKLIDKMRDTRRILRSYKHNIASSLPNYPIASNMFQHGSWIPILIRSNSDGLCWVREKNTIYIYNVILSALEYKFCKLSNIYQYIIYICI